MSRLRNALVFPIINDPMFKAMDVRPELAAQVPEGFRPVKRWRLAFKVWGLTTVIVCAIGTAAVLLVEFVMRHLFHLHLAHTPWKVALVLLVVCGGGYIPMFINVVRSYPSTGRWR